jgi:hypothetical protein
MEVTDGPLPYKSSLYKNHDSTRYVKHSEYFEEASLKIIVKIGHLFCIKTKIRGLRTKSKNLSRLYCRIRYYYRQREAERVHDII